MFNQLTVLYRRKAKLLSRAYHVSSPYRELAFRVRNHEDYVRNKFNYQK